METMVINQEFTRLADDEQIEKTVQALEAKGMRVSVFETGEEAREFVLSLIPSGAVVYTPPSRTVEEIGLKADIESATRFQSLRKRLAALHPEKDRLEYRKLVTTPDVTVGSVHAITENGQVMLASATGSQLGSAASGAGMVIWVVGTQKLVSDLEEGFRRIQEYSYPLEDARTRQVYSGTPSAINKILIVNGEQAGRINIVLVKQNLGF